MQICAKICAHFVADTRPKWYTYCMEATLEKNREFVNRLDIMITGGCSAHFHNQVELLAVRRGAVNVAVNGVSRRLTAGHAVIADSYAVHAWAPEPRGEGVVLIVPTQYLTEYAAIMKGRTFAEAIISDGTEGQWILKLLELLKSERPESLAARGLVTAILGEFVGRLPIRERHTTDQTSLMRDVLLYLTDNFTEPLSLEELAKKYGYTPSHFSRIFNAYTGQSISEYLGALRAERAAALLTAGQSATEAAGNAGFQSMRTFYRVFGDKYGATPREYLKTTTAHET